jgi:hypothetical protein
VRGPRLRPAAQVVDPVEAARKEQGVSISLAEDLRASRHQILKAHLAADYETAFDVMLYSMCRQVLKSGYGFESRPINVSLTPAEVDRSQDALKDTVAGRMLEVLDGAPTVRQAVRRLAREYGLPVPEMESEVVRLCRELLARDLIELADGDSG